MHRAAHQLLDRPRVFEDPVALAIVGQQATDALKSSPERFETGRARHMRAFMAARSRYAEDELARAIGRGARQYVLLGAGLDTFAYRNPYSSSELRVFEVDHPATQAWKRGRIDAAGIAIPDSAIFVPMDFERDTLSSALEGSGFHRGEIAFFSWLGVTQYLTAEAAMATLRFIASMPPGSGVVFDYAVERAGLNPQQQAAMDDLASRVARAGEPFQLFFEPSALAETLRGMGFGEIEDLGPGEIHTRYFSGRTDGLGVRAGLAHLMSARV